MLGNLNIYQKVVLSIFIIIEAVGFVGILHPEWHQTFIALTPMNLIFLLAVLLVFHSKFYLKEILWMVLVFLVGYGIEVVGVATGLVFGTYAYGESLGPKLFEVPPVMGVNWLLLCYTSVRLVNFNGLPNWVKAALSASLMVLLDIVMEPVAMSFDYWQWQDGAIPLQNYFAWWVVALGLNALWFKIKDKGINNFSPWMFAYLSAFFMTMRIWMT